MPGPNDAAGSHNSDPQFVIIFLRHASNAMGVDLAKRVPLARTKFDHSARCAFNSTTNGRDGPPGRPRLNAAARPAVATLPRFFPIRG